MSLASLEPKPEKAKGSFGKALVETFKYDNPIVRAFAIATVIWGVVGMSAGCWPPSNSSSRPQT